VATPTKTITKPLTYVIAGIGQGRKKTIKKNLEYAILVRFIDFNPDQYGAKIVIVDGHVAIKLHGRIYTEV